MRVLLYDSHTQRYFQSANNWIADPAQAHDFRGTVQAAGAAFRQRLKSFEIILAFDDEHMANLHVPLTIGPEVAVPEC